MSGRKSARLSSRLQKFRSSARHVIPTQDEMTKVAKSKIKAVRKGKRDGRGGAGEGLFANLFFSEGETVTKFTQSRGINQKQFEKIIKTYPEDVVLVLEADVGKTCADAIIGMVDDSVLEKKGKMLKFNSWYKMNHSKNPNVKPLIVTKFNGIKQTCKKTVHFKAIRNIAPGAELTWSYPKI